MFRKYWAVIVGLTVVGGAVGTLVTATTTPVYVATSQVLVSAPNSEDAAALTQTTSVMTQRVRTYAEMAPSTLVLEQAIDQLGLGLTPEQLKTRVTSTVPTGTTMVSITVEGHTGAAAADLANAVAASLITVLYDTESASTSPDSLLRFTVSSPAQPPAAPVSPQSTLNLMLGLLVGLGAGVTIALVCTSLDRRVRSAHDIAHITDIPVLAALPLGSAPKGQPLLVHENPTSPMAEGFRNLRTLLQFADPKRTQRAFVVTAAMPGEGISTTATNLAISLANAGASVALVEADMRQPAHADLLGLDGAPGLADVLAGRTTVHEATRQWGTSSLWVLPAGLAPTDPLDLLGSAAMVSLINTLDQAFDVVLYDAPPLLPVADATVLSRLVGGTLLVVASGKTRMPHLDAALAELEKVDASVSGLVLTMVPTRGPDSPGYGRYGASVTG